MNHWLLPAVRPRLWYGLRLALVATISIVWSLDYTTQTLLEGWGYIAEVVLLLLLWLLLLLLFLSHPCGFDSRPGHSQPPASCRW